jgi:zinc/manganese transport system substrate-binding protein
MAKEPSAWMGESAFLSEDRNPMKDPACHLNRRYVLIRKMKNLPLLCLFFIFSIISTVSAGSDNTPLILTTTTDLADITRIIVGPLADVKSIATGKEDPHFLAARPGYIVQARNADAWIRVGLELEIGWEGPILRDSRNLKIQEGAAGHIDASTNVLVLDVPEGPVTRDMGDVHPFGNPHYWLDPLNGRVLARTIASRLGNLFPRHSATFQENFKSFERQLDVAMFGPALVERYGGDHLWQLLLQEKPLPVEEISEKGTEASGWYGLIKPYQGQSIVTYHRSWIYLARRFGLATPIELEPKPGIPPSSKHLAQVVETVRAQNIRVILQEPFYSRKAADFIADQTGAAVVLCSNTVNGSDQVLSYLQLIDHVVRSLSRAMEKG